MKNIPENVPKTVWIENLNGQYRHLENASLTKPEKDDHRIMYEYIRKDIVSKEIRELVAHYEGLIDEIEERSD